MWTIWGALRSVLDRRRWERNLDDELQFHVEMQSAEYRRRGASESSARRMAQLDLNGVEQVKESCRDAAGFVWLQDLWRDLNYGCRTLARSPGFTVAAVLTEAFAVS
jgi:hypothetical protein